MKLYNYWRSSSSWRVRIALAHKNLPYEYIPVHLLREGGEQLKASFHAVNPMEQVPALVVAEGDKNHALVQSLAIIEYLEEKYPTPALLPKDLLLRARVRAVAEVINAGIQPLQNLSVLKYVESTMKFDKAAFAAHWVARGLQALEEMVKPLAGRCTIGNDVTVADVCLVPQLYAARRFNVNVEPFTTLLKVEQHLTTLPAFEKAAADKQIDAQSPA